MEVDILSALTSGLSSFAQSGFFHSFKILAGFVAVILLIANILLISKRIQNDLRLAVYGTKTPKLKKSAYLNKWERIKKNIFAGGISEAKIAIIEADQMLGEILERIGYQGKSTGEKIQAVKPGQLIGVEEAAQSHELAKMIVKDPKFEVEIGELQKSLGGYEKVFRSLELLD